jgi:crossover junction endodeoxyribonuclease RuvC
MRILGIDPGLITTGYGVVDITAGNVKILEAGTIEPEPKALLEQRLLKNYTPIIDIPLPSRF